MPKKDFKVPNIGNFKDVEIIEILIKKGQEIQKNDPVITIESDKSSVEIPATDDGTIIALEVKVGDKVSEGDKIYEIEIKENSKQEKETQKNKNKKENLKEISDTKNKIPTQNLIIRDFSTITSASPRVRKFARELGIDINRVSGSERNERVTENDIKLFVSKKSQEKAEIQNKKNDKIKQEYTHSEFGEIQIKDIPRVKRLSSKYLMKSWTNIPHVTNHDEADITELEEFRTSLTDIYTGEKKKLPL